MQWKYLIGTEIGNLFNAEGAKVAGKRMKSDKSAIRSFGWRYWFIIPCVLSGLCVSISAQEWKTAHDGVEYAHVEHKLGNDPVKINLLRLDLKKVRLDVHHALDKAIGLETTSSIAKRKGAVAAINSGFFRLDTSEFAGDTAGSLMIDGELLSESTNERVSMILVNTKKDTEIYMDHFELLPFVSVGGKVLTPQEAKLDGINRQRKSNEVVLYSPQFGETTLTEESGTEIALKDCRKVQIRGQFKGFYMTCRNVEIRNGVGNSRIPRDGYVLSISDGNFPKRDWLLSWLEPARSRKLTEVQIAYGLSLDSNIIPTSEFYDVVAGVPKLITNGKIDITWEQEKASKSFVETRHPRTAVAKMKDGKFLMITVDGRQPDVSVGMTLQELAEYILSLGATDAMNLDGGGSTTMFLDGKVVNTPSDKEGERKIGDAIVVTLRKKK